MQESRVESRWFMRSSPPKDDWNSPFDVFDQLVSVMSISQKVTFGALICERHLGDYVSFSKSQKWGDPDALFHALELSWRAISDEVSDGELDQLLARCKDAIPDADDFSPYPAIGCVQDAALMVCELIGLLKDKDCRRLRRISSHARDSADEKVQSLRKYNPFDPDLEEKILRDPLMVAELERQRKDLYMVERSSLPRDLGRLRTTNVDDKYV